MVNTAPRTRRPNSVSDRSTVEPRPPAAQIFNDPDLVDRIFDYIVQQLPEIAGRHSEIKQSIRDEFAGERAYVRRLSTSEITLEVARMFNGRNASEVARILNISRATVYRHLKQAGRR